MKMTKTELQQIIKEELSSVLHEMCPSDNELPAEEETLEIEPTSTYQPYPPGPIEKRIRKLEAMLASLLDKVAPDAMTPEEAEDIRSSLTPFRESADHAGQTCLQAHPNITHEQYEEGREASLKLTIK